MEQIENPGYTISSENPDFQNKIHAVFDTINGLESNTSVHTEVIRDELETVIKPCKPDFMVNPTRYTKYTLRDTELSDNAANSQIAFEFLNQLSHSNPKDDRERQDDGDSPFSKKHVFKMPEQPIGVSKPKERKVHSQDKESTAMSFDKVELDHLEQNSVTEFTNEIADKLDQAIKDSSVLPPPELPKGGKFKHVNKRKRNLREKIAKSD